MTEFLLAFLIVVNGILILQVLFMLVSNIIANINNTGYKESFRETLYRNDSMYISMSLPILLDIVILLSILIRWGVYNLINYKIWEQL